MNPRLDDIVAQTMEIANAQERSVLVERACAGDGHLRAEVETLLAAHNSAGSFIKATQVVGSANAIPSEKAGGRIGRYKLLNRIAVIRSMKALRLLLCLMMVTVMPGCATCRSQSTVPASSSSALKESKHPFLNWFGDQVVNNLLSWGIGR